MVSEHNIENWSLNPLHTDWLSCQQRFHFWPNINPLVTQKWPTSMVYDNWIVSSYFAMTTVVLLLLSHDAAIRSLNLLVLIYIITNLWKKSRKGWWNKILWMQSVMYLSLHGTCVRWFILAGIHRMLTHKQNVCLIIPENISQQFSTHHVYHIH